MDPYTGVQSQEIEGFNTDDETTTTESKKEESKETNDTAKGEAQGEKEDDKQGTQVDSIEKQSDLKDPDDVIDKPMNHRMVLFIIAVYAQPKV
jgi:hypothetical protein